jgi:hypothetical protein
MALSLVGWHSQFCEQKKRNKKKKKERNIGGVPKG